MSTGTWGNRRFDGYTTRDYPVGNGRLYFLIFVQGEVARIRNHIYDVCTFSIYKDLAYENNDSGWETRYYVFRVLFTKETVGGNGWFNEDVNHKITCGWNKWREASDVLCDKRIPTRLKGTFHKDVVRPTMFVMV